MNNKDGNDHFSNLEKWSKFENMEVILKELEQISIQLILAKILYP